ncbi:MAG: AAA domain-containing protein [Candidatus Pseudobacter hemicellulosilyticus]|uniref:AAA domain-containing protein n=1 Tax=Candidatus Pseudobacter hemicellulosilyticus TaxID=3121375 RepID=A0AAJ5WUT7_9BACT|nr:MAG: AAA domain-containing protein [Pseudobacter sp.]
MPVQHSFREYMDLAFGSGPWSTDEVIEFVMPLFEEVLGYHQDSQVAPFEQPEALFISNGKADVEEALAHRPLINAAAVQKVLSQLEVKGFDITERLVLDLDLSQHTEEVLNRQVQLNANDAITYPVYLPGYQCYEIKLGHHDALSDIFVLGLVLGSMAMGLDLHEPDALNLFAVYRNQPAGLNPRIHPTVCALVTEMTELDRRKRNPDLQEIIQRLKFYRDYDPQRQADLSLLAAFQVRKPADRRDFILSRLRNRLFDTSRRNRLLYYKPNNRFVNLTVSSVPMVLHYQSINPLLLFSWNKEVASLIIGMKDISLNKYLRFEDHPYLNAQLNGIRQLADNDKKEYGFSQLRLVVAFLHWHNLKEEVEERIQSPLLLLPVELQRKKSLRDEQFTVKATDNTALVNPILANHLKDLYGISLPESIDFDEVSMEQFFEMLQQKIESAKQGVKLAYVDKPKIRIIHTIARQTINNYRKRLKPPSGLAFHQVEYSYATEDYRPLGLELYRQKIARQKSSLEYLLDRERPPASPAALMDTGMPAGPVAADAPQGTRVKDNFELTEGQNNPYYWEFDVCNIVLGNFNYKKMSLVSDYSRITETGLQHAVFDELFRNAPRDHREEELINDPAQWYHVVTADPTQARSILGSRTGRSYIIQGPPGTGKSQTITNLIADFLARKKTVLFVCEKRAALDVVYHRLQQNKLSELCCYIHDSQADKKEFIRDLRTNYEDFLRNKMDLKKIRAEREQVLERLLEKIGELRSYHERQQATEPEVGASTRQLIEAVISGREQLAGAKAAARGNKKEIPHYQYWVQYGEVIRELSQAIEETGIDPAFAHHPFANLARGVLQSEDPHKLMDSLVKNLYQTLEHISAMMAQNNIPAQHAGSLEKIRNLIQDSVVLESLARTKNLPLVDSHTPEARAFEKAYKQYQQLKQSYQQQLENNRRWRNKFDQQELVQALALARKQEQSFFSFLNGNWRRLKQTLKQSYDFAAHQIKPTFTRVLEQLQEEYQLLDQEQQYREQIQDQYGLDNIDTIHVGIEVLRRRQDDAELNFLLQHPRANELVIQLSRLNNSLHQLELSLKQCLHSYEGRTVSQLRDEIATIEGNAEALKYLLPGLRKFVDLPVALQDLLRKVPLTPVQAAALMAGRTLEWVYERHPRFSTASYKMLEEAVKEIAQRYDRLLKLNSELIRAEQRAVFLEHYQLSTQPEIKGDPEKQQQQEIYKEGCRILEHEMGKTMRYKSIRELASRESGSVLKDIKPVWLMSPLSVSDSLPMDPGYFDVVIFDEASQIALEEGIPALFRAPQAIIVGDDKQMPPSNFFNARAADAEDLEQVDGENAEDILSAESDSLLIQGARKLPGTMLSWHYRSRYETLISYSNHAFYEAGLLTIPDRTIHHIDKPLLQVQQVEESSRYAGLLLQDSISFHYLPNAIYASRGNIQEAKYIAGMLRELLLKGVEESIGIVAFSLEQQGIIEAAINELAEKDRNLEALLEQAYNRKEDGQFTGLFIKNLENVQGDERDIIIISVCYGYDSKGKMLMNFGPINKKGGGNRLNVIFSRARKHMAIVSSIRHEAITNDYNPGASYFKRFLHYAEMVSVGNMSMARVILDSLVQTGQEASPDKAGLTAVAAQISAALTARGYLVEQQIGQSRFKCSLGVKRQATDKEYALGILVDDEQHYQNQDLVEQYYQRPAILSAFGWKLVNVFAKDWLEDAAGIIALLLRNLEIKEPAVEVTAGATITGERLPEPVKAPPVRDLTLLVNTDGTRFWEIEREGLQLRIRYGKVGTKGLWQIKSYTAEMAAVQAKQTLIAEQLQAGYALTQR